MSQRSQVLVLALVLAGTPIGNSEGQVLGGFGLRAGISSSNLTPDDDSRTRATGFHLAVSHEVIKLPVFSFEVELEYSQRGYGIEQAETDVVGQLVAVRKAVTRLHYLSLPALVRITIPSSRTVGLHLLAGPRVDWMIASSPGILEFTIASVRDQAR